MRQAVLFARQPLDYLCKRVLSTLTLETLVSFENRFHLLWTPLLKNIKGKTHQAVGLVCPPVLGSGGDLTLDVGGKRFTARKLELLRFPQPGYQQDDPALYLWLIPRPAKPVVVRAVWKPPLGGTFRDSLAIRPANPGTVHAVFKTHLDIGYTHRLEEVIGLYQKAFMEKLLSNLAATADRPEGERFVWTMSTWLLERCLDPKGVAPGHIAQLEQFIRQGRVVWGLMPFTTHSEFFGREEMCRSLYAARRLAERFAQPVPRAAKMTDVPAHTASLAMAFAAAGGTFFQIGTNPDSRPAKAPPLFWWKLPDEQRLLVHYHATYGTPLLPPQEWGFDEWLAIQITNDNVGPQSLDALNTLGWINRNFDAPRCRVGRLEDFADAVIRRHGPGIPTYDKELVDWWIHGIGSQAAHTATARRDKDRLPSAETVATMLQMSGGEAVSAEQRERIRAGFENLSLYTEHTWGDHATDARRLLPKGNLYTSPLLASDEPKPPTDRWVGSWEDKAAFARAARTATDAAQASALERFGRHLGRAGKGRGVGVALFNPLSRARGGRVFLKDEGLPAGEFELVDPTSGMAVVYERKDGVIEFFAPTVPGCGYLVLEARPVATRSRPGMVADWEQRMLTLHTNNDTFQYHTAGGLARWHDRLRSSQWCSANVDHPLGSFLYEMPGGTRMLEFARQVHTNCWEGTSGYFHRYDYEKMNHVGPLPQGRATVTPELTPLCARVVVEGPCAPVKVKDRRSGNAQRYRTTFTLYRGRQELYVHMELFGKAATYAAEAGYGYFPIAGETPIPLVDRILHISQPSEAFGKGINVGHLVAHHGVRIENATAGLNFYSLDAPLISLDEPGGWRFTDDADNRGGVIYATLFNNLWGTNFAQWQSGDLAYEFVLHPTGNDDWDGGLATGGSEHFRPLLAKVIDTVPEVAARSLLAVEPAAVQLVALKPADFGNGIIIRVWNSHSDPVRARLRIDGASKGDRLERCDLLERAVAGKHVVDGRGEVVVTLKSQELATFRWTGGRPRLKAV